MSPLDEKEPRRDASSKTPPVNDSGSTTEKKSAEHDAVEAAPEAKAEEATPVAFGQLYRWVSRSLYSSRTFTLSPGLP